MLNLESCSVWRQVNVRSLPPWCSSQYLAGNVYTKTTNNKKLIIITMVGNLINMNRTDTNLISFYDNPSSTKVCVFSLGEKCYSCCTIPSKQFEPILMFSHTREAVCLQKQVLPQQSRTRTDTWIQMPLTSNAAMLQDNVDLLFMLLK